MSAINSLPSSGTSTEKRTYEPSMEEILASIRRIIADDQSIPGRGGSIGDPVSTVSSSHELLRMPAARPIEATRVDEESALQASPHPGPAQDEAPQSPRELRSLLGSQDEPTPTQSDGPRAHGSVSAPQYPTPDGRAGGSEAGVSAEPSTQAGAEEHVQHHAAPGDHFDASHEERPSPAPISQHPPEEEDAEIFAKPIEPRRSPDPAPLFSAATDSSVTSAFNMLAASRLADNSEELMDLVQEMIRPLLRAWLDDNLPNMVERMVRAEIERVARGGR